MSDEQKIGKEKIDVSSLTNAVKRIGILYRHVERLDILGLRYESSIPEDDLISRLIEKLNAELQLNGAKVKLLEHKLSDAIHGIPPGESVKHDMFTQELDEIPEKTVLVMRADIDQLTNQEKVAFAFSIVPNLAERRLIQELVDKHSPLLFVFSDRCYIDYARTIRNHNAYTRTLHEGSTVYSVNSLE